MRFSLAIVSTVLLAQLTLAAPAAKSNMAIDVNDFKNSQISPLAFQGSFETFNWKKEGQENTVVDRVFSFDLSEAAELQVTDFLQGGDVYEIMDNGEVLTATSDAFSSDDMFAATPEQALEDGRFSKANVPLAAGKHEITINVADAANDNGSGAVRLVQKVQALFKDDDKDDDWKEDDDDEWKHDDSDSEDEWEHDDDEDDEWKHKGDDWKHGEDWKHDDDWEHKGKKVEEHKPEITKYYYVYYTETETETVSIHAHNHEHDRDRGHPRILINEPVIASASMMAPKAKASMLSLPFLPIH